MNNHLVNNQLINTSVFTSIGMQMATLIPAIMIPAIMISNEVNVWKIMIMILIMLSQELCRNIDTLKNYIYNWYYGSDDTIDSIRIYSHDIKKGDTQNMLYTRMLLWIKHLHGNIHIDNSYCDSSEYYKKQAYNSFGYPIEATGSDILYYFHSPYNTAITVKFNDVIYRIDKHKVEVGSSNNKFNGEYLLISCIKDNEHKNINNFIEAGLKYYRIEAGQYFKNTVLIFRYRVRAGWTHNEIKINKNFNNIFLPKTTRNLLNNICTNFTNQEEIYDKAGIPFKKGILLYGVPGSGKTSIIYAMARAMKRNIYFLPRTDLLEDDFRYMIENIPDGHIVVLEEIDTIESFKNIRDLTFKDGVCSDISMLHLLDDEYKRKVKLESSKKNKTTGDLILLENNENNENNENKSKKKTDNEKLSLYLEILDGYNYLRNTIVIMTTNCIEELDPAIYRSGRFDNLIYMSYADVDQITEIANFYKLPITTEQINQIAQLRPTTGYLINTCILPHINDLDTAVVKMLRQSNMKNTNNESDNTVTDTQETSDNTQDTSDITQDTSDITQDTSGITQDTSGITQDTSDNTQDTSDITKETIDYIEIEKN
jgi:AAA+ superfamily predicted ATPase